MLAGARLESRRMELFINGERRELAGVQTVADVVRALGLERAPCAVEVNRTLVPKSRHAEHALQPADRLEVVTLVGGG